MVVNTDSSSNSTNGMMYPPYLYHHHMLQDAPLFINDRTMRLSPYVDRLWLNNTDSRSANRNSDEKEGKHQKQKEPKARILLTDFGWNQPNQTEGMKYTRSTRMREITQAVIDHPLFDPTFSWTETMEKATVTRQSFDPYIQYFVFLDAETCFESNYPHYGQGKDINFDVAANRPVYETLWQETVCFEIASCHFIQRVLRSPLFQQVPTARLFFFECRGMGVDAAFRTTDGEISPQLSIVSLSSGPGQLLAADMGQPPPAINPLRLSSSQRTAIRTTCENDRDSTGKDDDATLIDERAIMKTKLRPYFFSFIGSRRRTETRDRLFALHKLDQGILIMQTQSFEELFHPQQITDQHVMEGSIFAAAPRGDNRFSYRFTEVLSAGAIPVIHSDGWVLPFSHQLIDWANECAVIIPENKVNETITILKRIDPATRCRMRKRCYDIYTKYMANAEGTVAGVLETASRIMS